MVKYAPFKVRLVQICNFINEVGNLSVFLLTGLYCFDINNDFKEGIQWTVLVVVYIMIIQTCLIAGKLSFEIYQSKYKKWRERLYANAQEKNKYTIETETFDASRDLSPSKARYGTAVVVPIISQGPYL